MESKKALVAEDNTAHYERYAALLAGMGLRVDRACDGVDALAMAKGGKTYRYGYLDKVLSVTDGDTTRTYTYHADGQLATATVGGDHRYPPAEGCPRSGCPSRGAPRPAPQTEAFLWDGLALIQRGDEQFMNEPHVGGGNPVASSKGTSYFNDALGTTVGAKKDGKYSAAVLSAFGENLSVDSPTPTQNSNFFTGKPYVEGLGHAFWMRNYRAGLAKWQTVDPMGYPDGWNALAYCGNGAMNAVDLWGCRCTNGDAEFIWHEYRDPIFFTYNDCIYPLDHPTIPASTDPKRIMDAIRSLNGMTVTFRDTTDVYSSSWEFFKTYDEVRSGNYEYKKELYLTYEITRTCHYAYYSKSSLLDSLSDGCTTVGAAAVIVSALFPEIAIPAGVVGNSATVAGFLAWLRNAITGDDCKTLIFTEYSGAWKDNAKVEFLHRRIE